MLIIPLLYVPLFGCIILAMTGMIVMCAEEWKNVLFYEVLFVSIIVVTAAMFISPFMVTVGDKQITLWELPLRKKIIEIGDIKNIVYPVIKRYAGRKYTVFNIELRNGEFITIIDAYIGLKKDLLGLMEHLPTTKTSSMRPFEMKFGPSIARFFQFINLLFLYIVFLQLLARAIVNPVAPLILAVIALIALFVFLVYKKFNVITLHDDNICVKNLLSRNEQEIRLSSFNSVAVDSNKITLVGNSGNDVTIQHYLDSVGVEQLDSVLKEKIKHHDIQG